MSCYFVSWCGLTQEAQAAWAQAILSVLAIGGAVWIASRQHRNALEIAKASVRPHLGFHMSSELGQAKLRVDNNGLGPAFIVGVTYYYAGEVIVTSAGQKLYGHLQGMQLAATQITAAEVNVGQSIRAGASEYLYRLTFDSQSVADADAVLQKLLRIGVSIAYKSIYGELFVAHTKYGLPGAPDPAQ